MEGSFGLKEIIVEDARNIAALNDWDDVHYLSDNELLEMYPIADFDFSISNISEINLTEEDCYLVASILDEMNQLVEGIMMAEEKLDDPDLHYLDRSDTRSDIMYDKMILAELNQKLDEIRVKYEGRSRVLHPISEK